VFAVLEVFTAVKTPFIWTWTIKKMGIN